MIFGVETDGCMKEWLVAIKLLSSKEQRSHHQNLKPGLVELPRSRSHSANPTCDDYRDRSIGLDSPLVYHKDVFELFETKRGLF